jgi:hypothetical protein
MYRAAGRRRAREARGQASVEYRCPNGLDTMGGTMHDTKNTARTRYDTMDIVSVPTRHDDESCLGRDLGTQCRHKHDTKNRVAHD